MTDQRATPDHDVMHASRTQRRDRALVAEYIHELSDRHGGGAQDAIDREPAGDGRPGEEGG